MSDQASTEHFAKDEGSSRVAQPEEARKTENDEFFDAAPAPDKEDNVDLEGNLKGSGKTLESDDESRPPNETYERLLKHPCCAFCFTRCPRLCAILIGVVVPLGLLIALSIGFGAQLCDYEAPPEIDTNDARLANLYWANKSSLAVTNLTLLLPEICFVLFLEENNFTNISEIQVEKANVSDVIRVFLDQPKEAPVPFGGSDYFPIEDFEPPVIALNVSDFYEFMSACGLSARAVAEELMHRVINNVVQASEQLTFNWIRCFKGAQEGQRDYGKHLTAQQRSNKGQTWVYTKAWQDDREALFNQYYKQLLEQGTPQRLAWVRAEQQAVSDATGGSTCEMNAPAAGWFWFTVQTTVGYGNTPPTTDSSRAMVYTIGFISILAFGGVLAAAGFILNYIFDDYADRYGFKFLTRPWVGAFIWGSAYYLWMVFISYVTIRWKRVRLDLSFSWYEGYWFSYISTTTVGFGDLVLEPEGIIGGDLFFFPTLFLVGFMYFAAFLGKFIDLVNQLVIGERKSLMETLLEKRVTWKESFQKERPSG